MLSVEDQTNVRRWMGYPTLNLVLNQQDTIYSYPDALGLSNLSLTQKLQLLTDSEQTVLEDTFLTPLAALETAIVTAADNLDTQSAGPYTANPREIAQRTALFNKWRRDMCAFLGFPAGPGLGDGGIQLIRS